jgi:hypothetical protein
MKSTVVLCHAAEVDVMFEEFINKMEVDTVPSLVLAIIDRITW